MSKNKSTFPKVLVCCPTAKAKQYCFEEWLDSVMSLSYPNFKVVVFDNSNDKGVFASSMNFIFKSKYGQFNPKFKALFCETNSRSVVERMTQATELMRQYAVKHEYEYILSLESDVFPPSDVIEELMFHKVDVVGALYDRDEGSYRKFCVQKITKEAPDSLLSLNLTSAEEELNLIKKELVKVSSVGLGCVLINMNILKNIPFRFMSSEVHPDQYFSETMAMSNVKIHLDTSVVCRHENKEWGVLGVDYK